MSKLKIELIDAGIHAMLKSPEITAACEEAAAGVMARCGDGYASDTLIGKNRVTVKVKADTYKAYRDCLKNNTLLKALRG